MPILTPTNRQEPPQVKEDGLSSLEQDVAFGYYGPVTGDFLASARKHYPMIPVFVTVHGFHDIRWQLEKSGKRFWAYVSEDIEFFDNKDLWTALACMINYGLGAVGLSATSNPTFIKKDLSFKETGWVPGYFMMVDSRKVGHVGIPSDLPTSCLDVAYSLAIKATGYALGIAPGAVFKKTQDIPIDEASAAYFENVYGDFYTKNVMPIQKI